MSKSPQQRLDDTLRYIHGKIGGTQCAEMRRLLVQNNNRNRDVLSQNISLGRHLSGNKEQRRARRALLLCYQLFIRDVGARQRHTAEAKTVISSSSEDELIQRIKSWFTLSNVSVDKVCATAKAVRQSMSVYTNNDIIPSKIFRGERNSPFNCYNAVVFWAFEAGAISLRWIYNNWKPRFMFGVQEQFPALCPNALIPFPALGAGGEYDIPPGHTIIMQRAGNPFGHTVMSIGHGMSISHNSKTQLAAVANVGPPAKIPHNLTALNECNTGRCHIVYTRFLTQAYYPAAAAGVPAVQGYNFVHHTPFWQHYPQHER